MSLAAPTPFQSAATLTEPFLASKRSANTKRSYRAALDAYVDFTGCQAGDAILRVPSPRIVAWRDDLEREGRTASTIAQRLAAIRAFYNYAVAIGWIEHSPADTHLVPAPRVSNLSSTPSLAPEEAQQILDAPDPSTTRGLRDRAILAVLLYHGLRREELATLTTANIRQDTGRTVLAWTGKGKREYKHPLRPEALDAINLYLEADSRSLDTDVATSLFGITAAAVYDLVKKYAKTVTPHGLRHTAITQALTATGGDVRRVAEFAGHADVKTTLRYDDDRESLKHHAANRIRY